MVYLDNPGLQAGEHAAGPVGVLGKEGLQPGLGRKLKALPEPHTLLATWGKQERGG